jgi:hypothetical protein
MEILTEWFHEKYSIVSSQEWSNILRRKEHDVEEQESG